MVGILILDIYQVRLHRLIPNFFQFFATYSILFPIAYGVWNFKKLDLLVKSLVPFLFVELGNELFAFYLAFKTGYNGLEYAGYFMFETTYFSIFFFFILKTKWVKNLIVVFLPIFIILGVMELSMAAPKTVWYTGITITESITIVILASFYYYELMTASFYYKLTSDPDFWIVTGILIYAVLSFFPFGFWNYLHTYQIGKITNIDVLIIAISNLFMYSFFTIAFLCPMKQRQLN